MSDQWQLHASGMAGGTPPVSDDLTADRAAVNRLIDLSRSQTPLAPDIIGRLGIRLTPWVACQFGVYTEHIAAREPDRIAMRAAVLAVVAGQQCGRPAQWLANTLTGANVFFQLSLRKEAFSAGRRADAADFYELILASPLSRGTGERTAAHLGLANICFIENKFADAAYYYDKCLPYLHLILDETGRRGVLAKAASAYLKCGELGGGIYCLEASGAEVPARLQADYKRVPDSLDTALTTIARLNLLGAADKAQELMTAWNITGGRAARTTMGGESQQ